MTTHNVHCDGERGDRSGGWLALLGRIGCGLVGLAAKVSGRLKAEIMRVFNYL